MSDYRIDSHKLLFHPRRVADWLEGQTVYPLYMEVSPIGACNHRCVFCGLDFMGYKPRKLDTALFKERLTEMGRLGLKSIMYAGEGEPFLHKDMVEIARHTKASGIDVAFTTNAVLFKPEVAEAVMPVTTWIKVSCNAGTAETYGRIHGTDAKDFDKVMDNLRQAVRLRQATSASCTLGLQTLLLPENQDEIETLAMTCRDLGLDYLVVKPYSQHPQSKTHSHENITYAGYESLAEKVNALSTKDFSVIFRLNAMRKWDAKERGYKRCQALPFWSYIDAGGGVWGCSVYLEDQRFLYGNINEESFQAVWEGPRRAESLRLTAMLNPADCRVNCRMDEINRYLWELKHPGGHVNFI
ncbi:radical SAM protein [Humidesulfovibrio sp.]